MVTTLYLVRHGETEGAEVRRYKGNIDVPLSKNGIAQMQRLSKFIAKYSLNSSSGLNCSNRLSAVYCSNLSRAVKSAEIIAGHFGLKPIQSRDLRERNFGIWEGMSFAEIKKKYPREFRAWAKNPLRYSPIKGESTLQVDKRVMSALRKIVRNHKGENIAMVSHGGVNRVILCNILGIPLENIFRIEQDYGAVNIIEFWDKYPVVKLLNGVSDANRT